MNFCFVAFFGREYVYTHILSLSICRISRVKLSQWWAAQYNYKILQYCFFNNGYVTHFESA